RLRANRGELVADLVDRGFPRDLLPLPTLELHWIFQAPVAVHELTHRGALGAMRTAVDRRIPSRLLADPHAVRHFGDDRAADRAMGAAVLANGHCGAGLRRRPRLGLAHARERQAPERCQRSGGEARLAQEAAAVEAAIGLALQDGGERAPAGLTFSPFDQHGCLP